MVVLARTWLVILLVAGSWACNGYKTTTQDGGADAPADTSHEDVPAADAPSDGGSLVQPLTLTPVFEATFAGGTGRVAVGDFDGDGHDDVAGTPPGAPYGLSILFGRADHTFDAPVALAVGTTGPVTSLVATDLDRDGIDDLIVKLDGAGPQAFTGSKTRTFAPETVDLAAMPAASAGPLLWPALANGNVLEIFDEKKIVALIPDGTGGLAAAPAIDLATFAGGALVAIGDVNGDGIPDVIGADPGTTKVGVSTGRVDGTFLPFAAFSTDLKGPARAVASADLDGDGTSEIVVFEGPAAGADHLEILSSGPAAPRSTVLPIPTDLVTGNYSFAAVGAQPGRGADLAVATPKGVAFVGQEVKTGPDNEGIVFRAERLELTSAEPRLFPTTPTVDDAQDLVVVDDAPAGGGAKIVRKLDTGVGPSACPALDETESLIGGDVLQKTKYATSGKEGAAIFFLEVFGGLCVNGSKQPVGEKTPSSPNDRQLAANAKEIETFVAGVVETFLSKWKIDRIFNNSELECGQSAAGYTICPTPKNVMPAGNYVVVAMGQAAKVPLADAANLYQYAAVFDADGDATNNFVPLAAYPKDFFKDTDRWYEALYTPGTGWKLKVSTAHGMTITPVTDSFARVVIVDNVVFFVIPRAELSAAKPGYRVTAFRHKGDFGLKPPYDSDANVSPPVDTPLASFP